ncbi:hypothetical protein ACFUNF_24985 [Streptomyces sp. NPDC057291]|uniref:hypothetical protein n=1 Tax=Streptomyces sp. NPDC057291 TaxID=3346087 RepID=UPI00363991A2
MENWREGARTGHTHEPNDVTVQLDGLGRQLSELTAEPGVPEGSDGPVFVDESGRRSKTFRRLGWVLAAVCACYAVTLVVALLGGNSSAPWLPLSGQKQHKKAEEVPVPAAPSGSADAVVPVGATPGAVETEQVVGGSATPSAGAGSGSASAPGKDPSKPTAVVPPKASTTTGGGKKPEPGTSTSGPPAATTTPPVDPGPTGTPSPPVESPDPPVQQEGAQ